MSAHRCLDHLVTCLIKRVVGVGEGVIAELSFHRRGITGAGSCGHAGPCPIGTWSRYTVEPVGVLVGEERAYSTVCARRSIMICCLARGIYHTLPWG